LLERPQLSLLMSREWQIDLLYDRSSEHEVALCVIAVATQDLSPRARPDEWSESTRKRPCHSDPRLWPAAQVGHATSHGVAEAPAYADAYRGGKRLSTSVPSEPKAQHRPRRHNGCPTARFSGRSTASMDSPCLGDTWQARGGRRAAGNCSACWELASPSVR
jgi:hypothetical protein